MKRRINKLTFFLFFISIVGLHAQEPNIEKTLVEVISNLETKYQVKFNYAEDIVHGIEIEPPLDTLTLNEAIDYLKNVSGLHITLLSPSIILIQQSSNLVLCGYVKDSKTQQPLSLATIKTLENSTTSDNDGFFRIQVQDLSESLEINYLGYRTLSIEPSLFNKNECINVFLAEELQELGEVLISNFIVNGINKINNGSFEINFSNFDMLPGLIETDVLQSVQSFPGIQSINETVSNINIRGGTHDQNLLLWDGIKMYQSGHFFGLISMYNPQITQRVYLRKNGSSASFSDGVSGTIDMQTERDINPEFHGIIGVNLTNLNAFVDIPIGKKSSLQIAARNSISDFIRTPTYNAFFDRISQNTEVENNQTNIANSDKSFDFYDTSLRWLYKISGRDQLRVNFINVNNKLVFDENATVNNQNQSRQSSLSQFSIAGAINYERIWNTKLQTNLEIYETDYKLKSVNANILDSQKFLQENSVSETSTKLTAKYDLSKNYKFLGGYHFVETEVTNLDDVDNPLYRLLVSEVLRSHGFFSEINYSSYRTNLSFGVRYNYLEKFKKNLIEPRISFSQRLFNYFTWEVLGELKHQNTSQVINFQSDFLGIEKRRWQLSNDANIPVIQSKQISTGFSFNKDEWLLSHDIYYKNVKGITAQSQGFQNQFEFETAIGSYNVKGFDMLIRKSVDNLNTWLSYSLMDNTYEFDELYDDPFPSNYNIIHSITLGTSYKVKNLKMSAGFNWHSGKPTTYPVFGNEITNGNINYQSPNKNKLKDYLRLDFSTVYNFKLGEETNADLGLSIWNMLDRKNEINNFFRNNNDVVIETNQNSLGITPNAVLRIYF